MGPYKSRNTRTKGHQSYIKTYSTCGIFEHHLSFLDLQGDEVVFLIEASIIEEKTSVLQGGKTRKCTHTHRRPRQSLLVHYIFKCLYPENTQYYDTLIHFQMRFLRLAWLVQHKILKKWTIQLLISQDKTKTTPASLLMHLVWKYKRYSSCTTIGAGFHTSLQLLRVVQ